MDGVEEEAVANWSKRDFPLMHMILDSATIEYCI